jgi:hypothetical protein
MLSRGTFLAVLVLGASVSAHAQLSQDARFAIMGKLIAAEGAARIPMPLGKNGVELSDKGVVDTPKLQKELSSKGSEINPGKIVTITDIEVSDKQIEFEIDHGGTKKKKSFLSNIQIGMGGASSSSNQQKPEPKIVGSKITLKFAAKIAPDLSVEALRDLLNPVMDFAKQSNLRAGIEALPPEFQDAVAAKEARVGMDANIVMLSMGPPNRRIRSKNDKGVEQEDWVYEPRSGNRKTFVTFEKDVVVEVRSY